MSASSVFAAKGVTDPSHYAQYDCALTMNHLIVGGIPSTPNTIRGWLKSRLDKINEGGVKDAVLEQAVQETLQTRFADAQPSVDELVTALMASPDTGLSVNGFKRIRDTGELAYESRCMKAALKEALNVAYPGVDWTDKKDSPNISKRKGLKSTGEERIFVLGTYIGLGVKADEINVEEGVGSCWVEERIKHVDTAQGPRSAINRVEVVYQPRLTFQMAVADDFLGDAAWRRVWETLEKIGIGSDRGRSDGQFTLDAFDKVGPLGSNVKVG